jgi:hypothetical protein
MDTVADQFRAACGSCLKFAITPSDQNDATALMSAGTKRLVPLTRERRRAH